jgi:hypothetical protein
MWSLGPRFGKPEEHGPPTIAVVTCILAGMLAVEPARDAAALRPARGRTRVAGRG